MSTEQRADPAADRERVAELLDQLQQGDQEVRKAAAKALLRQAEHFPETIPESALPTLVHATRDDELDVRWQVT